MIEQISSDGHQMSPTDGSGGRARARGALYIDVQCTMDNDHMATSQTEWQTCENITFPRNFTGGR